MLEFLFNGRDNKSSIPITTMEDLSKNLAALVGLTVGTPINEDSRWEKITLNDKVLLFPLKPIRRNISWENLYKAGVVYGDDSFGLSPIHFSQPVLQNKRIIIDGLTYRVRLMGGADTNPTSVLYNKIRPIGTLNSEYDKLIIQPYLAGVYTLADLGEKAVAEGTLILCRETHTYSNSDGRVTRGRTRVEDFGAVLYNVTLDVTKWRPVLELVE